MACASVRKLNPARLGAEEQTGIVLLRSTLEAFLPSCSAFIGAIRPNMLISSRTTVADDVI